MANTLFGKAKNKYLADIIKISSPEAARISIDKLQQEFYHAKTREKQMRIYKATDEAGKRAAAALNRKALSQKEHLEMHMVSTLYKTAAFNMHMRILKMSY
jgi:hypothetical protein